MGAVVLHLAPQRFDAVELQFFPNKGDEGDVERFSIEIALEIEQEELQQRRAIVEGRAAAEAGDAIKAHLVLSLAMADPNRIDAMLEPAVLVEADIGGGIAEIAAAFLAMDHQTCNEPRAAEHRGGGFDLPLRERHPDRAGGDRPLLDIDVGLHIDLDAEPGRFVDQEARRSDPALAEMKIVADRDAADPEPLDQVMVNEILRRGPGTGLVETHHDSPLKPGSGQQPQLCGLVGKPELGGVRTKKAARMRLARTPPRP